MTGTNQRGLRERQKHKKRVRIMKIFTLFAVCIGVVLLISKAAAYYGRAIICITAKSAAILRVLFLISGNGLDASTAIGVKTG